MSGLIRSPTWNAARPIARAAMKILCFVGFGLVASGAWIPTKAVLAQLLLERAFDRSRTLHHTVKPWPWADTAPVARLSVPRLGQHQIVLDTGSGQALAFGPTIVAGGRSGSTTVMAAHRDTHFRFLADVHSGDVIYLENVAGQTRRFQVVSSQVIRWDEFGVDLDDAGPALVLATCYPFRAASHGPLRYVVRATEIPADRA